MLPFIPLTRYVRSELNYFSVWLPHQRATQTTLFVYKSIYKKRVRPNICNFAQKLNAYHRPLLFQDTVFHARANLHLHFHHQQIAHIKLRTSNETMFSPLQL